MSSLALAVQQKVNGVTGDNTSSLDRAANTPSEMLGVATRLGDSAKQAKEAWSKLDEPDPKTGKPPTKGEKAARVIRATQQTIGVAMSGLGAAKDMLDVGFANLTAPLAAITPSMPAATLTSLYVGTPHCHPTHPPSGPPPIPPTPLPSIGMVTLGMCVKVLINYMPAARADDIGLAPTCCGLPPAWFKIKTGSSNVFIGGSRAARLSDICQACKNIPDPPAVSLSAVGKVASAAIKGIEVMGKVAGVAGIAADVAEASVESDNEIAAGKAIAAATAAAQMAMDAAKAAVEKTMWKDPTMPPTGSIGAIVDPSHFNVLIGGFPMINIPDPVTALLNKLKFYKAKPLPPEGEGAGGGSCPI